jgi:hypothetical protein
VLHIILEKIIHAFVVKRKCPNILEKVFFKFPFNIIFYLGGKEYGIPCGTVVTGILDMRPKKHDLHFLVDVELLPHAFVNIPDEKMNIGVFTFIFIIYYMFIFFYIF